jgi:hypothetical protein
VAKSEESPLKTQKVGGSSDSGIDTDAPPLQSEQSANTEPGTEPTMQQPQQSETSQSDLEFIVPKIRYGGLRHAMDESENLIYLTFSKSGTFMRARSDTF